MCLSWKRQIGLHRFSHKETVCSDKKILGQEADEHHDAPESNKGERERAREAIKEGGRKGGHKLYAAETILYPGLFFPPLIKSYKTLFHLFML